jgi:predicted enzyme related to lactoylglutathione lyase
MNIHPKEAAMSNRDHYPTGVPCFVDTLTPDVDAAKRFYGTIFGWDFIGPGAMPDDPPGEYFVARVRGHDVAAIGTQPAAGGSTPPSAWNTHIAVASADETAAEAQAHGGALLVEPFDAPPAGRMAVIADPSGAVFCVWEAGVRQGAQLVNEPSAWAMSALTTDDPEGARAFYGELFGWRAESFDAGPGQETWLWRLPGYVGGEPGQPVPLDVVAVMMTGASPPANWSVDFWIADADAAAAAAPEFGGQVMAAPADAGGFRRTVLADPHGAIFSASQLLYVPA